MQIVCPNNAGTNGCGVYWTGDDVDAIYNSKSSGISKVKKASGRKLMGGSGLPSLTGRQLLDDASDGCVNEVSECLCFELQRWRRLGKGQILDALPPTCLSFPALEPLETSGAKVLRA